MHNTQSLSLPSREAPLTSLFPRASLRDQLVHCADGFLELAMEAPNGRIFASSIREARICAIKLAAAGHHDDAQRIVTEVRRLQTTQCQCEFLEVSSCEDCQAPSAPIEHEAPVASTAEVYF